MPIFKLSSPEQAQSPGQSPNPSTINSGFTESVKDSFPKETIAYICGLRARIECERLSKHSTHSDRVTTIGYCLF